MAICKQWMDKDINIFHIEKYVVAIYWKDNDSDNKGYWEFDTLINSRENTMNLIENETLINML